MKDSLFLIEFEASMNLPNWKLFASIMPFSWQLRCGWDEGIWSVAVGPVEMGFVRYWGK